MQSSWNITLQLHVLYFFNQPISSSYQFSPWLYYETFQTYKVRGGSRISEWGGGGPNVQGSIATEQRVSMMSTHKY